ncbi:DUF4350 domain-containing protein [Nesterenkonia populi]|uniref:DUF4350 domain-containing protein n=1 Tax=Nesterenkonia populi TaxID=1591087 RepID=UPI0011BF9665|nr:DUF4350 domain-containing protein [Nesterenkonia populi]
MTAAASAATAAGLGTAARGLIARWQFWIILLLIGAAVAAAVQLLAEDEAAPYGLSSTELNGYGALAAVLEDEGITLQQARSGQEARELMDQTGDAGVVVMLPPNSARSPEDQLADQLMDQAAAGEREALWIVGDAWTVQQLPSGLPQDVLDLETGPAGTAPEIPAGEQCGLGPAQAAETIQAPGVGLLTDDGCFPLDPEGHLLAETERGMVLGVPEALTNQHITAAGNAALALGLAETLASEDGDLIWYTPSAEDAAGQQEQLTPGEVLDDWMLPVLAWLIVAGLIGAVAAGRRDGPVVVEPLPAEVHAGELAEGRARLYQRADARAEAAEALRTGTLRRLGRTLRLGARPAPENVVTAAARRTGRDQHELAALLQHPRAGSSPELVAYAQALHQLEQQTAVVETATEENR